MLILKYFIDIKLLFLPQKINTNVFDYKLAGTSLIADSTERFLNILRVSKLGKTMANLKQMKKKEVLP